MEIIFPVAGALLVLLEVVEGLAKRWVPFLPLGGNHIAQVGIILGLAFVILEIVKATHV